MIALMAPFRDTRIIAGVIEPIGVTRIDDSGLPDFLGDELDMDGNRRATANLRA